MAPEHRSSTDPYCQRFGSIAVEKGFLSSMQLQQALTEQLADRRAGRTHRVIGAICFTHGWMTPQQIDIVLNRLFQSRAAQVQLEPQASSLVG